jgi:lipoate-protein ligase A
VPDSKTIRELQDPPLDGPTNMARDEALMIRVGEAESPPTLRLYQWNAPTISLGYFQPYAEYESLPPPAGELAIVRRLTGGGAILHDLELTYSITVPADHRLVADTPNRLYEVAHDALMAALESLDLTSTRCNFTDDSGPSRGPFFCFERRHAFDVLIGSDRIAGSAQRRTRTAVLQHGSIILGNRYAQQTTARVPLPLEKSIDEMRTSFAGHLADITGESIVPGEWHSEELAAADRLVGKYAGKAWTRRT